MALEVYLHLLWQQLFRGADNGPAKCYPPGVIFSLDKLVFILIMHNMHISTSDYKEHNMHNSQSPTDSGFIGAALQQPTILVYGCGNTLMGDDGFGPAVMAQLLAQYRFPLSVRVEDVGTSIRDLLFDLLLAPQKPEKILIIDAAQQPGRQPGELFELPVDQIGVEKVNDFSVHHFPSLNLLQDLAQTVEVRILTVQVSRIPEEIQPGLSPAVAAAIPRACAWVVNQLGGVA